MSQQEIEKACEELVNNIFDLANVPEEQRKSITDQAKSYVADKVDEILGPVRLEHEKMNEGFEKFHIRGLMYQGNPFYAVIHHFTGPDEGDPHDHPFGMDITLLKGEQLERIFWKKNDGTWRDKLFHRHEGSSRYVQANTIHRIESLPDGECYTLMMPDWHEQRWGSWILNEDGSRTFVEADQ